MGDCANFNCTGYAFSKRLRCGKCQKAKKYICCCCPREVNTPRKLMCESCQSIKEGMRIIQFYHRHNQRAYIECQKCGKKLGEGIGERKWCKACRLMGIARTSLKKYLFCDTCGSNLLGTGKTKYCSDECYGKHRVVYLREKRIKKRITTECVICFKDLMGTRRGKTCGDKDCIRINNNLVNQLRKNRVMTSVALSL